MGNDLGRADGAGRKVTFLGRRLALRSPTKLTLLVCPLCSQRNGARSAEMGTCVWCGYEPAERDEVHCGTETRQGSDRGMKARPAPAQARPASARDINK